MLDVRPATSPMRRRSSGVCARRTPVCGLVVVIAAITGQLVFASASIMGDECDWVGSGLSSPDGPERGVTPVYLRCAQGRLDWAYPRGALRVLLRIGATGRDFRGCVRLGAASSGARVFLEGPRSLAPLFASDDAGAATPPPAVGPVRCFHSRGGSAALYVEAVKPGAADFLKQVASFTYDLEPLPRGGKVYDQAEECRPCTKEEMARAFCTSDLVTRGFIRGVQNQDALEVSELTVRVTRLLRQDGLCGGQAGDCENLVTRGAGQVTLQVPSHCGARHGTGEFVFMARRKLGELTLACAPRLEDWAAVVSEAQREGTAHCVLAS